MFLFLLKVWNVMHNSSKAMYIKGIKRSSKYMQTCFCAQLNIHLIFNLQKVFGSFDLDLYVMYYDTWWTGQKLFQPATSSTCYNIHSIWWYGWIDRSLSFSKLFLNWKLAEYWESYEQRCVCLLFQHNISFNPFNM